MHYHIEIHGRRDATQTTDDKAEAEYGARLWRRRGRLGVKGVVVVVGCDDAKCPEYLEHNERVRARS
jgi:hypothetical protein